MTQMPQKLLRIGLIAVSLWLGVRYLLPIAVPFLLGGLIAFSAEPGVRLLEKKLQWRRFPATALCVSLTLLLFLTVLSILSAAAVRELGKLGQLAPMLGQAVDQGLYSLEDTLLTVADKAPDSIRPALTRTVLNTFQDGSALLDKATAQIPGAVAGLVSWLSKGVLTLITAVLSGFMISARLPRIRSFFRKYIPKSFQEKGLPALKQLKSTFGKWIGAQLKLMLITWAVVGIGLTLLKIPYGILWAGGIALIDAVPILGTGTVMIPWAVIRFLQGDSAQGVGLLVIFAGAWLVRNLLEPRLIGKSLGLDPLLALAAFYVGLKLWGLPGMLLLPVGAALVISMGRKIEN